MNFCSYFGCDPHFFELNNKYEEILKLDKMLTETSIPHILRRCMDGWQVCYPDAYISNRGCIMDAIEHFGSYGVENDKLEIMGLLTPNEENFDSVLGYLTAENVFERIKAHYEGKWDEYVYKVDGKHEEPMAPEEAAEEMRKICSKLCYFNG